ncbi:MAG: toprim domain-containing protein, partial [Candidatus Sungiibacteriota bacterium]
RVIGFGGRIFDAADSRGLSERGQTRTEAKYINTPQTLIYDKSRALYGFDKAKQEIRAKNNVVVTEGYMDCVMSHQAGVAHTIAVSGTALTLQQLKILRRLCDTMICSFDADAAGDGATRRSLALAAQHDFTRLIAAIPSGKDPADTVRENPEAWRLAVAAAKPVVAFYFDKAFREENPATADGKKKIAALLLPWIAELADEIEKSHWIADLARRLAVPEEAIRRDLQRRASGAGTQFSGADRADVPAENSALIPSRRRMLEDRLVALLAVVPAEAALSFGDKEIVFSSEMNARLFRVLTAGVSDAGADLVARMEDMRFIGEMLLPQIADVDKEILVLAREIEKIDIKEHMEILGTQIGEKERVKDGAGKDTLLMEHRKEADRLHALA